MKQIHYYIIGLFAVLVMASCSSSRKAMKDASANSVHSVWKTGECVVARTNIELANAGDKNITVGGTLKMKRDDVIQLNATYILGIQVGTMEMTRDSVLFVSRATKQYAVFGYQELSALLGRAITFEDMQNIFWGETADLDVKGVTWKYGSFTKLEDGRRLPDNMELAFSKGSFSVGMVLNTSSHKLEDGWTTRTKINTASYGRLTSDQIVRLLTLLIGG